MHEPFGPEDFSSPDERWADEPPLGYFDDDFPQPLVVHQDDPFHEFGHFGEALGGALQQRPRFEHKVEYRFDPEQDHPNAFYGELTNLAGRLHLRRGDDFIVASFRDLISFCFRDKAKASLFKLFADRC